MRARNPQGIHRLSAAAIKYLNAPSWHADGGGLYLEVDDSGRKRWAMRLTVNGKRRDFGLGPLHKVSLLEARERAGEYRSKAYRGIDPIEDKRRRQTEASRVVPTFEEAARQVHEQRRGGWSNGKHVDQWLNTLIDHAFPIIDSKPVNMIGTPEVLAVLTPIWLTKPETARRVKQRVRIVLDWAERPATAPATIPSICWAMPYPHTAKNSAITPLFPTPRLPSSSASCVAVARSRSPSSPLSF